MPVPYSRNWKQHLPPVHFLASHQDPLKKGFVLTKVSSSNRRVGHERGVGGGGGGRERERERERVHHLFLNFNNEQQDKIEEQERRKDSEIKWQLWDSTQETDIRRFFLYILEFNRIARRFLLPFFLCLFLFFLRSRVVNNALSFRRNAHDCLSSTKLCKRCSWNSLDECV